MGSTSSRFVAQSAIIKPCDLCEKDYNVNWLCKECNQNICDTCRRFHLRSNVSRYHSILLISDGFEHSKEKISDICQNHSELFIFFCKSCNKKICSKCLIPEHTKHDFIHLIELLSEKEPENDEFQHIIISKTYMEKYRSYFDGTKETVEEMPEDIGQSFESLQPEQDQPDDDLVEQNVTTRVFPRRKSKLNNSALSALEFIEEIKTPYDKVCDSMCKGPDESIWMGCFDCVIRIGSSRHYRYIYAREDWITCFHIACLQSGDAVASYGGLLPYIDVFTNDGECLEFANLSPNSTYHIDVTIYNEVVINVNLESLVIFSGEGKQLCDINIDGGIRTFCANNDANFIIAHQNSSTLSLYDRKNGKLKPWSASKRIIYFLICDRYEHVIAANREKQVYLFSKYGTLKRTFTVDGCIRGLCINHEDNTLILREDKINGIFVSKYLY